MQIPRGLDDRGVGMAYAAPGRTRQPAGQPGTAGSCGIRSVKDR
ncbi:hypothetical protein ABT330_19105 [Streptomyces sp. NPDC000658]